MANVKTKVGPCWRSFIQGELSRGSHKSPNRVRNAKIKEHNTGMTETRVARVDKTPGIRLSLPPFTKYIDALIK